MARQGTQLESIIREEWGAGVHTILDAATGTGTQALAGCLKVYRRVSHGPEIIGDYGSTKTLPALTAVFPCTRILPSTSMS